MQIADIKCEIEKLRTELYKRIESVGREGICHDKKLYEMSRNIDELINAYTKEQKNLLASESCNHTNRTIQ